MWIIIGIAATSNLIGVVSAIMTEQEKQKALDLRNALARKERMVGLARYSKKPMLSFGTCLIPSLSTDPLFQ
mgnify:CR=1 FL=1